MPGIYAVNNVVKIFTDDVVMYATIDYHVVHVVYLKHKVCNI